MQPALPLTGNPLLLGRLAGLYLYLFWGLLAFFYVSAFQAGYDQHLALLSCTVAAIACVLLRLEQKGTGATTTPKAKSVWQKPGMRTVLALDQMLQEADRLRGAPQEQGQVGLTLISAQVPESERLDPRVLSFVREYLFRQAHSRVFQIDGATLAILEVEPDLSLRLSSLASDLQSEFKTLRRTSPTLEDHRLIVGVAIANDSNWSSAELLAKARSATKLAETLKRDTFFRQV
jgi:hypothetical protein